MERTTSYEVMATREERLQSLLLGGLAGDEAAYREFLTALSSHLRGFLRRRLAQRPGEVEDLLQEVLLAVHNARHTYRAEQPLTVWVQAIARYKLADHFRAFARRDALSDSLDEDMFEVEDSRPAEARRDLGKLLQHLPERQRLPIIHVKLEGRSVEETAQLTGLSSSAVKVGIHRGLKALAMVATNARMKSGLLRKCERAQYFVRRVRACAPVASSPEAPGRSEHARDGGVLGES